METPESQPRPAVPSPEPELLSRSSIQTLISKAMAKDRYRLQRQLRAVDKDDAEAMQALHRRAEASSTRAEQRQALITTPDYPPELPVAQLRERIVAAIQQHQVIIVCGETGSGKTTQLPKMCLEAGRGVTGFIGHTQPRRLAARSVSARIADELNTVVGEQVGFKIRFNDQVGPGTLIKLMTDGMLLAEFQQDRFLNQYDTIIIDEAHERSLNIDFLLGCLKRLLSRRRDLKVIITSATIDPQRFAGYFDGAPVILAEGRSYPVELLYRPAQSYATQAERHTLADDDADDMVVSGKDGEELDLSTQIIFACQELLDANKADVLVFLSGEREIREVADALNKFSRHGGKQAGRLRGIEVLPLFARLSNAEQNRIFQRAGKPRIVLATNVAETSLTVPGIRSVVDAGHVRMSRYSVRSKLQRLPIEKISRASANQRKGRCGREAPGICIRLYAEDDFDARPEFTEPEILRTNLASVILQMALIKLGRIEEFPFIEAPEGKFINDGYRTLQELGALDAKRGITPLGKQIARFPVDPRLARMLLAATEEGCLEDVLTIVAALSVQDPRDRPFDKRQAADEMHAEFHHEASDFLAWLNLYAFVTVQKQQLSNSRFRKMCRQRFLSPIRIAEWFEVRRQLQSICGELKLKPGVQAQAARKKSTNTEVSKAGGGVVQPAGKQTQQPPSSRSAVETPQTRDDNQRSNRKKHKQGKPGGADTDTSSGERQLSLDEQHIDKIHRALLSGLLVNVATRREKHDYLGTRNRQLHIFPGSALFRKGPKWLMAAEVVETTKVFARQVATVQPEWIERAASHLLQKSWRDPHWNKKGGFVSAWEQATLYGLIINSGKRVNYSSIDAAACREIFIHDALVDGQIKTRGRFLQHNLELLDEVTTLEDKSRRRDIVVDPLEMVRFYDQLLPEAVNTTASFEKWRKEWEQENPRGLFFSRELLVADDAETVSDTDFPDHLEFGNVVLPLQYHFVPGEDNDGVTLVVPVELLNRVSIPACEWLVPGLLVEKITALIKSLPKSLRRNFVPAPDFADAAATALVDSDRESGLLHSLSHQLQRMTGVLVERDDWDADVLPPHLVMRFSVVDGENRELESGRDLRALQRRYEDRVEEHLLRFSDNSIEQDNVVDWNFGDLPESVELDQNGVRMRGYPALSVRDEKISVTLFASAVRARVEMRSGLVALYRRALRDELKYLSRRLPDIDVLSLRFAPFAGKQVLVDDIVSAAIDHVLVQPLPFPRQREQFLAQLEAGRRDLVPVAARLCEVLVDVLDAHRLVAKRIGGNLPLSWVEAAGDIQDQIARMLYPGFVADTGFDRLPRLRLYFQAIDRRLDGIDHAPDKDRRRRAELLPVWERFKQLPRHRDEPDDYNRRYQALRWSFEELRLSLFAQELGANEKVSVSRLESRLGELNDSIVI